MTLANSLLDLGDGDEDAIAAWLAAKPKKDQIWFYRELAREHIAQYIAQMEFPFAPAKHHDLLIKHLEAVECGECNRLMVCMPPGSGKSMYTSQIFPPWYLGRNPEKSVIAASHTQELIERFGRRARNLYASPQHREIFGVGLAADSMAAARWETEKGGEYYATGIGGAITGRRADLGVIDDPVKSREDADSDRSREKAWDWYINDFLTRLKPGAAQVVVACMTGDTPVLMADGSEKSLRTIRQDDDVATYEDGNISSSRVLNWKSQGHDFTYEIMMMSGITVRANGKHPFLVAKDGELRWVRLQDLMVGNEIVRAMRVGGLGRELSAERPIVKNPQSVRASACRTTINENGLQDIDRRPLAPRLSEFLASNTVMASRLTNISACLMPKTGDVLFAESLLERTPARIGAASSASIIATRREKSEGSSATIATSPLGTEKLRKCSSWPLNTFEITHDEIVSIEPCGVEEVFDIQVERTENFIANGLVSHNTRWHEDDLSGRILEMERDRWTVIALPMEARTNDPLGRKPGERLWPEWFTAEMMADAKRDVRAWNALYQQEPAGEDGDYFKRDWFQVLPPKLSPGKLAIYGASDYAVSEGKGDYTEHGIFGIDTQSNIHVIDWWRGQTTAEEWIEAKCDLIIKHEPLCWFGESGPIRRAVEPFLIRRMDERRAYCRLEWLPSISDKPTRCRAFQALAANGKVYVPRLAPWKADVVGQLLRFPAGMHDDAVDVCSLIGRGLMMVKPPEVRDVNMQTRAIVGYASAKRRRYG